MFATFDSSLDGRLADLDLPPEARQQLGEEKIDLGAVEVPEGLDAELATTVERAVDEAFVSGYRVGMLVAATLALASALSAALLIEREEKGQGSERRDQGTRGIVSVRCRVPGRDTEKDRRCTIQLIQPVRFAIWD